LTCRSWRSLRSASSFARLSCADAQHAISQQAIQGKWQHTHMPVKNH